MKGQPCQGWGLGGGTASMQRQKESRVLNSSRSPWLPEPRDAEGGPRLDFSTPAPYTTYPLCAHPVLGLGEYEGEVTTRVLKKALCASSLLKAFIFYCLNNLPPYHPTLSQFYRWGNWGSGDMTRVTQGVTGAPEFSPYTTGHQTAWLEDWGSWRAGLESYLFIFNWMNSRILRGNLKRGQRFQEKTHGTHVCNSTSSQSPTEVAIVKRETFWMAKVPKDREKTRGEKPQQSFRSQKAASGYGEKIPNLRVKSAWLPPIESSEDLGTSSPRNL